VKGAEWRDLNEGWRDRIFIRRLRLIEPATRAISFLVVEVLDMLATQVESGLGSLRCGCGSRARATAIS